MTNEQMALILSQKYGAPKNKNREIAVYQSAIEMAEWKDRQPEWHERMHDMAMKDNLTNKEFREMLEKMPDDALICVECCNPKAMVYDLAAGKPTSLDVG